MREPNLPVFLYLDDGFPESRDYGDNYLAIPPAPVLRVLADPVDAPLSWPRARAFRFVRGDRRPDANELGGTDRAVARNGGSCVAWRT